MAFASLAAAAAIGLTACGAGASATSNLAPQQMLDQAVRHAASTSSRFTLDGSLTTDTSHLHNVTPAMLQSFGPLARGLTIKGKGEGESQTRIKAEMTVKPGTSGTVYTVSYDGTTYISADGRRYRKATSSGSPASGCSTDLSRYLSGVTSLTDRGPEQQDGVAVEHLQGSFSQDFINKFFAQCGNAQSNQQTLQLLQQVLAVETGTVDAYARRDNGDFDRIRVRAGLRFDLDKLLSGAGQAPSASTPGGFLSITVDMSSHYTDWGAAIKVTQPLDDPTAPTPGVGTGTLGG